MSLVLISNRIYYKCRFPGFTAILAIPVTILFGYLLYKLLISLNKESIIFIAIFTSFCMYFYLTKIPYYFYGLTSKWIFEQHANGQIQLDESPLKVPSYAPSGYCNQFTDDKGKPITRLTGLCKDRMYCGVFWGLYNESVVILPFKLLSDNKVEYWAEPNLRVIAPISAKDAKFYKLIIKK